MHQQIMDRFADATGPAGKSAQQILAFTPPPTWFPFRAAWIATVFLIGLALSAIWIRAGFYSAESEFEKA